jgi:hypothetical protein
MAIRTEAQPDTLPAALDPNHSPEDVVGTYGIGDRPRQIVALDEETGLVPADNPVHE